MVYLIALYTALTQISIYCIRKGHLLIQAKNNVGNVSVDTKLDRELASELPCPIVNSYTIQSPAISFFSTPQFTLLSSHALLT